MFDPFRLGRGAQLIPTTPCPIPAGKAGLWIDSADGYKLKYRKPDGTDVVLGG